MNKVLRFGETVEGYNIPKLNDREIRTTAGMLLNFDYKKTIAFAVGFRLYQYILTICLLVLVKSFTFGYRVKFEKIYAT